MTENIRLFLENYDTEATPTKYFNYFGKRVRLQYYKPVTWKIFLIRLRQIYFPNTVLSNNGGVSSNSKLKLCFNDWIKTCKNDFSLLNGRYFTTVEIRTKNL
jgi:hypothetical protein